MPTCSDLMATSPNAQLQLFDSWSECPMNVGDMRSGVTSSLNQGELRSQNEEQQAVGRKTLLDIRSVFEPVHYIIGLWMWTEFNSYVCCWKYCFIIKSTAKEKRSSGGVYRCANKFFGFLHTKSIQDCVCTCKICGVVARHRERQADETKTGL